MSTPMIEPQIADEELVVPPLPGWFVPAALAMTVVLGLVIWYLWVATDPAAAMAGPSWLFLCH
ncbi:hypothetical protein K2Z83_23715 [Oscillochloris sp. ZM17-4]|uniref:hypothetical protein n=1 Tax=Oscillochloris sp. ZM17-4 TaxID=2866714 RepID=UPI001C72F367|nr:hypothetical protein [Oscillochloris sp. ZM17-4]MBX0330668.1 hypothetical protein [Oscillochloris sp. ZM17-4]